MRILAQGAGMKRTNRIVNALLFLLMEIRLLTISP
jgi:hypothetical protein